MRRRRTVDIAVLVAALALMVALTALRSTQNAAQVSEPSTYDTGANGYAALYDLLAREDVRVQRLELPLGELSARRATLVIAGNQALAASAPSASALTFLDRWVRRGGHLVVLDAQVARNARRALGLPQLHAFAARKLARAGCALVPHLRGAALAGTFGGGYAPKCASTQATLVAAGSYAPGMLYRRGRGTIALFATPTLFDNLHLAQRDNARLAYAVFGTAPAIFEERIYGHAAGRTFWEVLPQPMRVAIWIAVLAALLAIAGANLPSAPPAQLQPPEERDSGAYIASLARMLERGGAAREAIARISARCEQVLGPRSGGDERARMLLRELRTLEATPRPGPQDVLTAGHIFARVRKDYGC